MTSGGSATSSRANSKKFDEVKRTTDALKSGAGDLEKEVREMKRRIEKLEIVEHEVKKLRIDLDTLKFDLGYRQGLHFAKNRRPEVRKTAYSSCTAAFGGDGDYADLCGDQPTR